MLSDLSWFEIIGAAYLIWVIGKSDFYEFCLLIAGISLLLWIF